MFRNDGKESSPGACNRGFAAVLIGLLVSGLPLGAVALEEDCNTPIIYLNTQEEVNQFQANYGPCTRVIDDLYIQESNAGSDHITDLSPLSGLVEVVGGLVIVNNPMLTSLNGLENVTSAFSVYVSVHPILTSLEGLSGLANVSGFIQINGNAVLTNLQGLSGLTNVGTLSIFGNLGLQNLSGLPSSLQSLNGLDIGEHPSLVDLQGLPATLTQVRSLAIFSNSNLVSLQGLPAISNLEIIYMEDNDVLNDLGALANSTFATADPEVTGVYIYSHSALTDLEGLPPVVKLGDLDISNNPSLASLAGLNALQEIWGTLTIRDNQALSDCDILTTVLDNVDDGDAGPGTGVNPNDPPDTPGLGFIDIAGNLSGCNSIGEILAVSEDVIHADGFESN